MEGPLIAIVGPTAVGKTALSVRLARDVDGEIVSADSRQIYKTMDIGTAKATRQERRAVPHHLIDVVAPDESFTLAQYQEAAYRIVADVLQRGKVPFLVGGTGLYIRAVLDGLGIPRVPPNPQLRQDLYARAEREGNESLHRWLAEIDPQAALAIDARNVRRVVRALEVYLESGSPISVLQRSTSPDYRILRIGLTMDRARLYERIDARVARMLDSGLVDEVRKLLVQGYDVTLASMSAVGYRQIAAYLEGRIDYDEAVRLIKHDTRRFVRQQYNWFRLDDPLIRWFDVGKETSCVYADILSLVEEFIATVG